jgi:hypothetical protein
MHKINPDNTLTEITLIDFLKHAENMKNSGQVIELMEQLSEHLRSQVRRELSNLRRLSRTEEATKWGEEAARREFQKAMTSIISKNQSTWSGGMTIHNLGEQIKREEATRMLEDSYHGDWT